MITPDGPTRDGRRLAVSFCVVGIVVAYFAIAAFDSVRAGSVNETPCWILPNLRAMAAPGDSERALRTHDAVRKIGWGENSRSISDRSELRRAMAAARGDLQIVVGRDDGLVEVALPIRVADRPERLVRAASAALASALLLVVPLLLLQSSASRASVPLAVLNSAYSIALSTVIAGQHSYLLTVAGLAAVAILPATLVHLGLRFPRERQFVRDAPGVVALPYLVSGFLLGLGWFALTRAPLLWPAFVVILMALIAMAWTVLMASCWFAARESELPIERARARLVFHGSILLPLIPAATLAISASSALQEAAALYLWSAAATLPFPLAIAISRYNLFDLGLDARQAIARLTYLSAAALVVSLVILTVASALDGTSTIPGAAPVLALSFVCVAALEPLRSRVPGLIESAIVPRLRFLRGVNQRFELESARLDDEDGIAVLLGKALSEGVSPKGGCVFLNHEDGDARLAYVFGQSPPSRTGLAIEAADLVSSDRVIHLAEVPRELLSASLLRSEAVEVVASAEAEGRRYGVVLLLGASGGLHYTGLDLEFIASLVAQAGRGLSRARAHAKQVDVERRAAAGRLALVLAHDTGKDINWMTRLAARMPRWRDDELRWTRDARAIAELGEDLLATYGRIMAEASQLGEEHSETPLLDDILDRTVRRIAARYGRDRITEVVDPSLRTHRFPEYVGRVIGNLIENALEASPLDAPIHLYGTCAEGWSRIVVEDRGDGPPEAIALRIFEAGISSRTGEGGSGIGLTVAREIAEMLGGSVTLERLEEAGITRATLLLPTER